MKALLSPTDLRNLQDCRAIFWDVCFMNLAKAIDLEQIMFEWFEELYVGMSVPRDLLRDCGFPSHAAMMAGLDDRDPDD